MVPSTAPLSDAQLEQTVRAGTEQLLARVGVALASQEGWADQLRAVAHELCVFLREDEGRARAMVIEAPHGNAETRRIREGGIEMLVALIDIGRAEVAGWKSVPRSTAQIAAGAIYNRIHLELERGIDALDADLVRELMYTAMMPYLGIEAALAELERPTPAGCQPQATA